MEIRPKIVPCSAKTLKPQYTEKEFLRNFWISVAGDDVSLKLFSEIEPEVTCTNHTILVDRIVADVDYVAVGQRSNVEWRTVERERPEVLKGEFTTYNSKTHRNETTKYKIETGRMETYETEEFHTDTYAVNYKGKAQVQSTAAAELVDEPEIFEEALVNAFDSLPEDVISPADSQDPEILHAAYLRAMEIHESNVGEKLSAVIDDKNFGDTLGACEDIRILEHEMTVYETPVYQATFSYGNETRTKQALPFGKMTVAGDGKNFHSRKYTDNGSVPSTLLQEEIADEYKKQSGKYDLLSCLVCGVAAVLFLTPMKFFASLILLALAVGAQFFISNLKDKLKKSISEQYRNALRDAVNQKLQDLGCQPVSAIESSPWVAGRRGKEQLIIESARSEYDKYTDLLMIGAAIAFVIGLFI